MGNDRDTLREALRVTKPGGKVIIFAPNRFYPFETHGVYLGKRYVFGNIPLVNYLPDPIRNRLVPHARAYTKGTTGEDYAGAGRALGGLACHLPRLRQRPGAPAEAGPGAAQRDVHAGAHLAAAAWPVASAGAGAHVDQ